MMIFLVTPVKNVVIARHCVRNEKADMFFSKVFNEASEVSVYDITDRKEKAVPAKELNAKNHRIIINNKKFFICSIKAG